MLSFYFSKMAIQRLNGIL
jgi:hypothetical protein